ncbi:Uncharacterised protein [Klebsiella pneumoniae]|nr:Uncharacterised protein [Klebsiella pneumoniae]
MNVAPSGTLHHKIKIGAIIEATYIINKGAGKETVFLEYAGDTKTIVIQTNLFNLQIIRQYFAGIRREQSAHNF